MANETFDNFFSAAVKHVQQWMPKYDWLISVGFMFYFQAVGGRSSIQPIMLSLGELNTKNSGNTCVQRP